MLSRKSQPDGVTESRARRTRRRGLSLIISCRSGASSGARDATLRALPSPSLSPRLLNLPRSVSSPPIETGRGRVRGRAAAANRKLSGALRARTKKFPGSSSNQIASRSLSAARSLLSSVAPRPVSRKMQEPLGALGAHHMHRTRRANKSTDPFYRHPCENSRANGKGH